MEKLKNDKGGYTLHYGVDNNADGSITMYVKALIDKEGNSVDIGTKHVLRNDFTISYNSNKNKWVFAGVTTEKDVERKIAQVETILKKTVREEN